MNISPLTFLYSLADRFSKLGRPLRLLIIFLAAAIAVILVFLFFGYLTTYLLARDYVDEIAQVFDLNENIAKAIVWATFAGAIFLLGNALSFYRWRRLVGLTGILGLLIFHSLILSYGTLHQSFDRKGRAIKCYILTRDSIRLAENPGIDPISGRECRPITPEIAERVDAYKNGKRPTRIEGREPIFFDPRTGQPIVWFSLSKNDEIQLFDLMGFHPDTGEELLPVTKEIVNRWKTTFARQVPNQIEDPEKFGPFDPVNGRARVWYYVSERGAYEFYDAPGYHPQTGETLKLVTREVMSDWQKTRRHWFVITPEDRNHPIRYCEAAGIDPATGRECREIKPQILERLREYEKGKRAQKITGINSPFFDLQSGEPIVWYYRNQNGTIEIYDLMGYHPTTGEELLPITKEIASEYDKQEHKAPPQIPKSVLLNRDTVFFDPVTGAPLLWYSRKAEAEYEFFDAPGFNPQSGEPLKSFTKAEMNVYDEELKIRQKKIKDEEERVVRQRSEREAEDLRKRQEFEAKQQEEQKRREEESRRLSNAARMCDELAGNPNDTRGMRVGLDFAALKARAQEAFDACSIALRQSPFELRFKYQLGRASEWIDRRRALRIHEELANLGYPAAFDNLGWLYYEDLHKLDAAVSMFRKGVQAGDPDSMVSLAEMIANGRAFPMNPAETKLELYRRAAQLGHAAAARAYQVEVAQEGRHQQQLEQQKMMLQFFGAVLQRIPR